MSATSRQIGPVRAVLISLAGLGLGYVYVGRMRLAIALVIGTFGFLAIAGWSRMVLMPAAIYALAGFGLLIGTVAIVHSALIARQPRAFPAKTYNRWWVYVLWALGTLVLTDAYLSVRADWFGYEPFRLPANSMAPTLDRGDFVMSDTWRFDRVEPLYGDLVIFEAPRSAGTLYVKRIVGLPGDHVEIRDDVLYRNGEPVDESYIQLTSSASMVLSNFSLIEVPENSFFVLGDNRHNSRDSRFMGPIQRELLHGRVEYRWFSYDRGIRWERFPERIAATR